MKATDLANYDPLLRPQDPYATYQALRRDHPIYYCERREVWLLSRFLDVQAVARNWETFSHAKGVDLDGTDLVMFGRGDFLQTDPPRHDELRNIVRKRFTPRSVAALEAEIRAICAELSAAIREAGEADVVANLARPLPHRLACKLFGVPASDLELVVEWTDGMLERDLQTGEATSKALASASSLRGYFGSLATERRRSPQDDLISEIVEAQRTSQAIDDEEMIGMAMLLWAAGASTTIGLLSSTFLAFGEHPQQRRLVASDPSLLPAAIEEVLRFESPLQHSFRTVTRPTELCGQRLEPETKVLLLIASANRDESRWERAEEFDIARPPLRNLGFGEGVHHCLGAPLARLEGRIALETFLAVCPEYEIRGVGDSISLPTQTARSRVDIALCA